ncbi:MAG: Uma2 family endonuclease [Isosphaeraceae bacterium]
MPKVMICSTEWKEILRQRRLHGHDRKDEVWNGEYFITPDPTNSHQRFTSRLQRTLEDVAPAGSIVQAGGNISDRKTDWKKSFRCPDVMVFLPGNPAIDMETHFFGGPDFLVEVVSPGDRSLKKLPFYASVGTREVLLPDQHQGQVSLYRRSGEGWAEPAVAVLDAGQWVGSELLPLEFSLASATGSARPQIQVRHRLDDRLWCG